MNHNSNFCAPDLPGDDPGSNEEDPVQVYRDFLEQLPQKIEFLEARFDLVVGRGLAPAKAVEVLKRAVDFFGELIAAEQELAAEAGCE